MRHPVACFIIPLLLLAGCEAPRFPFGQTSSPKPARPTSLPSQSLQIPDVLSVPPENMRQALADAYRLRPDKRFLLAVAEVYSLLTGQPRDTAAVEFRDSKWSDCRSRGVPAGSTDGLHEARQVRRRIAPLVGCSASVCDEQQRGPEDHRHCRGRHFRGALSLAAALGGAAGREGALQPLADVFPRSGVCSSHTQDWA